MTSWLQGVLSLLIILNFTTIIGQDENSLKSPNINKNQAAVSKALGELARVRSGEVYVGEENETFEMDLFRDRIRGSVFLTSCGEPSEPDIQQAYRNWGLEGPKMEQIGCVAAQGKPSYTCSYLSNGRSMTFDFIKRDDGWHVNN